MSTGPLSTGPFPVPDAGHCESLSKQFAKMILNYLNGDRSVRIGVLEIPLSNFFRMSQMVRYDTYHGDYILQETTDPRHWAHRIAPALQKAFTDAYGGHTPKEVDRFQETLRDIDRASGLPSEQWVKLHKFLRTFITSLEDKPQPVSQPT